MISGIGAVSPFFSGSIAGPLSGAGTAGAAASGASSFAAALGDAATNAVGTLHNAEQMSLKALSGDADTREVVDAVMSAEQTLQAAIAIRDKIVTAYLEISRMAV